MTLPSFLICGIQKGGTTALHAYLETHPDVFCPDRKELNFFDQHWDRGRAWYESFFQHAPPGAAVGEASPHYQHVEAAAERIQATVPSARLICILRDPVARAFSNYNYNLGRGQQNPDVSFERAIASADGHARYLDKGCYLRDLTRLAETCGRERLLVLFAENLRAEPERTLERAFTHIGVDPARWNATRLTSNRTAVPTSPTVQRALYTWGRVRRRLQPLVPAPLARATRGLRVSTLAALPSAQHHEPLAEETRDALGGFYAEANRGLVDWLRAGREGDHPLPAWLEAQPLRAAS